MPAVGKQRREAAEKHMSVADGPRRKVGIEDHQAPPVAGLPARPCLPACRYRQVRKKGQPKWRNARSLRCVCACSGPQLQYPGTFSDINWLRAQPPSLATQITSA
ncbi:hypothetical protein VTK56DRAFT_6551 [Thermocarpiscus australiensis]